MELEVYVIGQGKEKAYAAEVSSVVRRMDFLERFAGSHTPGRIADHWFALKQELLKITTQQFPEEEKPAKGKK